jgi:hypothetical protein
MGMGVVRRRRRLLSGPLLFISAMQQNAFYAMRCLLIERWLSLSFLSRAGD